MKKNADEDSGGFAITNHGTMNSIGYMAAAQKKYKDKGVKLVYGCEFYSIPSLDEWAVLKQTEDEAKKEEKKKKKDKEDDDGDNLVFENEAESKAKYFDPIKRRNHLVLFAYNQKGLTNLYRLVTRSHREGFYRKPRIDFRMLEELNEGIVASSACIAGIPSYLSMQSENTEEAHKKYDKELFPLMEVFGKDRFYLELQFNKIPEQQIVNQHLVEYAKKTGYKLIVTADSHYPRPGDWKARELYRMLGYQMNKSQDIDKSILDKSIDELDCHLYLKNGDQLFKSYKDSPFAEMCPDEQLIKEAIERTYDIAHNFCENVRPDNTTKLPKPSKVVAGKISFEVLKDMTFAELKLKGLSTEQEYFDRLVHELKVIKKLNLSDYFLLMKEILDVLREHMLLGDGRGCLSERAMVRCAYGLKNIKEINVGDEVFDGNGNLCKVSNVFEYDINEDLIEIDAHYGGYPIQMTSDHKVLVSKVVREKDKSKLLQGYKYVGKKEPCWIEAKYIEEGDIVVCPKTNYSDDLKFIEIENPIYSYKRNAGGVKNLAKLAGVSASTVYSYKKPERSGRLARKKLEKFLDINNIDLSEVFTKNIVVAIPSKININFDFGKLLGLWISDGWLRTNVNSSVGFCCRKSEDSGEISKLLKDIFNISPTINDHKTKDLRQFTVNHKGLADWFRSFFPDYKCVSGTKYIPDSLFHTSEEFRSGLLLGLWSGDGSYKGKTKYSTVSKKLAEGVFSLLTSLGLHAAIKCSNRVERRKNFRKNLNWTEYSVVSAPYFKNVKTSSGFSYDNKYVYYRVRSVKKVSGYKKVYDITIPTTNSYLTDGFLVHNSGAGSLVNYLLDVTLLDPVKEGLLFERFLSSAKASADIDCDVEIREDALEILKDHFGNDNVIAISNYNKLQLKSIVKDISKLYGIEFFEVNAVTSVMEKEAKDKILADINNDQKLYNFNFEQALKYSPTFRAFIQKYPIIGVYAESLYQEIKSIGKHAGGIIVIPDAESCLPIIKIRGAEQSPITEGVSAQHLDYFGLIKYDILGLTTLKIIRRCIENILKIQGNEKPSIKDVWKFYNDNLRSERIDSKDEKVFKNVYHAGKFPSIFQFEQYKVQDFCMKAKPESVKDLAVLTSLFRPGPLSGQADKKYLNYDPFELKKEHPIIQKILGGTRGLIVFQEQFMKLAHELADLSLEEADVLRKILVKPSQELGEELKKKRDEYRIKFIEGCVNKGLARERATKLWDEEIIGFISYGFNKSLLFTESVSTYTEDGKKIKDKQILEIIVGDYVKSRDEETKEDIFVKVLNKHDHGVLELVEIELDNGKKVCCTVDHKFRTFDGRMLPLWKIMKENLDIVA